MGMLKVYSLSAEKEDYRWVTKQTHATHARYATRKFLLLVF
jgi:hypothetical protein